MEDKEAIDDKLMEEIAGILKVPVEAIRNFDEAATVNFISTTFHDQSIAYVTNYIPPFNPMEKIVELYEALVKSEKEKNELLQRMLNERK